MSIRLFARLLVIAMVAAGSAAAQQAPAATPAPKKPGGVAVTKVIRGRAVVMYVDIPSRNVTVKINGALHSYTLADSVKGIMDIKQGDTLTIDVVESLGVYLKAGTKPPVGTAESMMTVQPEGKPAITGVETHQIAGTIAALDYTTRIMSIAVPQGDTVTFVADTSLHDLHGMKVGESVVMRWVRGIVVSVQK